MDALNPSLQFLLYPMEQSVAENICPNLFWCPTFNENVTSNTEVPKTNQTSIWMLTVSVNIHINDSTKNTFAFQSAIFQPSCPCLVMTTQTWCQCVVTGPHSIVQLCYDSFESHSNTVWTKKEEKPIFSSVLSTCLLAALWICTFPMILLSSDPTFITS